MSGDEDGHVPAYDYSVEGYKAEDAYQCHSRLSFIDIPEYKSTQEGADYFNNDKKKFVEDAIRRSIIYYEKFKKTGVTFSETD